MSETKVYHIEEIMQMLPHRYPFLLVDRLEVEVPGENFSKAISLVIRLCRVFCRLKLWRRPQVLL